MQRRFSIGNTAGMLRDMCLMDNEFFSVSFDGDKANTQLMLGIILGRDDLSVVSVKTQKEIRNMPDLHSVCLDIAATDRDGNLYDIEIQRAHDPAERMRARFYSAMMDVRSLGEGMDYGRLPQSYVIFIDEHDAIGRGRALYRMERMDSETCEPYGDGSHIIHVSASLADEGTDLGKLMHDLRCTDPEKMYYTGLRERTSYFKYTEEGKKDMSEAFRKMYESDIEEAMKEGIRKGIRKGIKEGIRKGSDERAEDSARRMIQDGSIPLPKIAEFLGLPFDEVEKLKSSISL